MPPAVRSALCNHLQGAPPAVVDRGVQLGHQGSPDYQRLPYGKLGRVYRMDRNGSFPGAG